MAEATDGETAAAGGRAAPDRVGRISVKRRDETGRPNVEADESQRCGSGVVDFQCQEHHRHAVGAGACRIGKQEGRYREKDCGNGKGR